MLARMRAMIATLALALVACGKASSPAVDLSTPEGAARCQYNAIRAKNLDQWLPCMHPAIRESVAAERDNLDAKRWRGALETAAPLEHIKATDFTIEPMPADKQELGDQHASFSLGKDSLELVRKDGRWYIADTGI